MLVLTRKLNEAILIDGQVRISVVKIEGRQVRLAIEAPQEVRVLRAELLEPATSALPGPGPEPEPEGVSS